MKYLLKLVLLQGFWFLVMKADQKYQIHIFMTSIILVILNFYVYKPQMRFKNYFLFFIFLLAFGLIHEGIFYGVRWIEFPTQGGPWFLLSLYVIFVCYYGDIFNKFLTWNSLQLFFLGGSAGLFSYFSGVKIANANVTTNAYYLGVFVMWAIFFPLSFKIYENLSKN